MLRRVILESPYAGPDPDPFISAQQRKYHIAYARVACRHAVLNGNAPILSHLLYTQPGILRDEDAKERQLGIDAGLTWKSVAEASLVYTDFGISKGMQYGMDQAKEIGLPVELIKLGDVTHSEAFLRALEVFW